MIKIDRKWAVAACGMVLLIWGNSLVPGTGSGSLSLAIMEDVRGFLHSLSLPYEWVSNFVVRKCAHFTEYMVLGVLVTHAFDIEGRRTFDRLLPTVVFLLLVPSIDETIQLFVPGRAGMITDVNVACLGEVSFGCAQGLTDVVYLTIGTGVGAGVLSGGQLVHGMMHPEAGHILVTRDPRDTIGEHSGCPFHDNCLEGLIAGPGIKKRWDGKSAGDMADDPEAMDLLAGYLAQALMTYTLCYAPQKIIIGGGVADHTPIVPLARKKCAEMLNGYIVTPEVNDIDTYIVNNSLEGKQGIMGCLALGAQALQ